MRVDPVPRGVTRGGRRGGSFSLVSSPQYNTACCYNAGLEDLGISIVQELLNWQRCLSVMVRWCDWTGVYIEIAKEMPRPAPLILGLRLTASRPSSTVGSFVDFKNLLSS